MLHWYLRMLETGELLPGTNRNILQQTIGQVARWGREIRRVVQGKTTRSWLEESVNEKRMLDMISILDSANRIGTEEDSRFYGMFLGLVITCFDSVFYAQKHRKNLHLGKYKALFKLISDEIRRDTNREPSQLLFTASGELFIRTAPPEQKTEVK